MLCRNKVLSLTVTPAMALLAGFASGTFVSLLPAQSTAGGGKHVAVSAPKHYQPDRFAGRAGKYYALVWGVDGLR